MISAILIPLLAVIVGSFVYGVAQLRSTMPEALAQSGYGLVQIGVYWKISILRFPSVNFMEQAAPRGLHLIGVAREGNALLMITDLPPTSGLSSVSPDIYVTDLKWRGPRGV